MFKIPSFYYLFFYELPVDGDNKSSEGLDCGSKIQISVPSSKAPLRSRCTHICREASPGDKFQEVDGVRSVQNTIGARLLRHCHELEVEAFAGISA